MAQEDTKTATKTGTPPGLIPAKDPAAVSPAVAEACRQITAALDPGNARTRAMSDETFNNILVILDTLNKALRGIAHVFHPGEDKRMVGAGIKNLGFIYSAIGYASTNDATLPPYVDLEEWRDVTIDFLEKRDILAALRNMENTVHDTMLWSGDEAYHFAVRYYNYIHEAARQDVPGMKAIYDRLQSFFAHTRSAKDGVTEEQAERDVRALLHGTKSGEVIVRNVQPVSAGGEREIVDDVAK